jgi:ATP-dependent Clp protease ATP-binding subunit ClpA
LVTGELSFTDRAADALRGAAIEALEMGHNYIGTEHILLALFRDPNSVASKALSALGTGHDAVRSRTDELLAAYK